MRTCTSIRGAVASLAALSIVLGAAAPALADSSTPTTDPSAPATASEDDSSSAPSADGDAPKEPSSSTTVPSATPSSASTAPTPPPKPSEAAPSEEAPTAASSTAASIASTIAMALEVAKDGNGPFTPKDEPGGDASATNGIVRTLDAITYRVTMNSTGGASTNERFTLTAPAGTSWAGVPAPCKGTGSAISGQDLTCNLGTIAEGQAVAVPAVLNVSGDLKNGDQLAVTGTGTADNADNGSVSQTSPTTTVSAAARYNLSKNIQSSVMKTDVEGPGGKKGVQLMYPIAVDWEPLVAGQGLLGFEKSAGPMTFTDDISKILGDLPSGAQLWNGDDPACGLNSTKLRGFGALPAGKGGGPTAVADSGTIDCHQSAPGQNVDITITGTVTDATKMPTQNEWAGPITGGRIGYVVAGYISFWMPNPPANTSVDSINTYTPLQTTSISGAPNFPGGTENLTDNVSKRNIVELAGGGGNKRLYRTNERGSTVWPGSAKDGDPWATAGNVLRSDVSAWNNGLASFKNMTLCDTFDRSTQRLNGAAWVDGLKNAKVQYAAYDMTSPAAGQKHTCDDADGPWYNSPNDVPGGINAVGAIRATGDLPGGESTTLRSLVTTKPAADGTRAYDFGHLQFGDRQPGWVHDWMDPTLGAGGLADSVILTENLARITKKIIDAGHDASDTPDKTSFAVSGNTIDYALYPTLTNGNTTGTASDVTVQDVLPLNVTYVAGSASKTPEIDTIVDADGKQHQRLTWTLHDVTPNSAIAPLTYTAAVSKLAPAGPVTNQAVIESPSDRSDEQYRDAQRAVQIVTTGGVGVEKSALAPVVVNGDHLEWKLGYTNTDASPIRDADLIDVLPYEGDARNSSVHGTSGLAEAVQVDHGAQETVTYTNANPRDIALDGKDPSNQKGGSTTWCAEDAFGTDGCPSNLADVTAFRIQRGAPIAVGDTVTHQIALATKGAHNGDTFTNRFGLRASNLALPVQSNPATIRVVSGAIGDYVWTDSNGNGIQDAGEPGIPSVPVHLTGTDDLGNTVDRTTDTDDDGHYGFGGLRPGEYVVTFTAPDGRQFTKTLAGNDRAIDSDATDNGSTAPITIGQVTTRKARSTVSTASTPSTPACSRSPTSWTRRPRSTPASRRTRSCRSWTRTSRSTPASRRTRSCRSWTRTSRSTPASRRTQRSPPTRKSRRRRSLQTVSSRPPIVTPRRTATAPPALQSSPSPAWSSPEQSPSRSCSCSAAWCSSPAAATSSASADPYAGARQPPRPLPMPKNRTLMPATRLLRLTGAALTATIALTLAGCSLVPTPIPHGDGPSASSTPSPEAESPTPAPEATTADDTSSSDLRFGGDSLAPGKQAAWDMHVGDLKARGWELQADAAQNSQGLWTFNGPDGMTAQVTQLTAPSSAAADLDDEAATTAMVREVDTASTIPGTQQIPLDGGGQVDFLRLEGVDSNGKATAGGVRTFVGPKLVLAYVVRGNDITQARQGLESFVPGLSVSTVTS